MNLLLLFFGTVIALCILMNLLFDKLPLPSLLLFIGIGMCFGENGFLRISFSNYQLSEMVCSIALLFIMFYGGFGTNIRAAKPVMARSFLLSTVGVALTAGLVGGFVRLALGLGWLESLLIGSVISSTDAASVFSVLRTRRLSLRQGTDSLLELESGSNDPVSYMLTLLFLSLMTGEAISVPAMLFRQMAGGVLAGLFIGWATVQVLGRINFHMAQGKTIFLFAAAVIAYALPALAGGNGYLSVYLCGIYVGNSFVPEKRDMVKFFDALTGTAQMLIFFLLGLLVTPLELPEVFLPSLLIFLFMTLVGRPLAVALVLRPFGASRGQIGLVSWAGLRGVASIVFSIYVVLAGVPMHYPLFNLVFVVVLLSLTVQGTLLPAVARRLDMIDAGADVLRTFNDYQEENDAAFFRLTVDEGHPYAGRPVRELGLPPELLIAVVLRQGQPMVTTGDTVLLPGDLLVMAAPAFEDRENLTLHELNIGKKHRWAGRLVRELSPEGELLIIMVKRGGGTIIPDGSTRLLPEDTLVVASPGRH